MRIGTMGGMLLLDTWVVFRSLILFPVLHWSRLQGDAKIFAVVGVVHHPGKGGVIFSVQRVDEVMPCQVLSIASAFLDDIPPILTKDVCKFLEQVVFAIGLTIIPRFLTVLMDLLLLVVFVVLAKVMGNVLMDPRVIAVHVVDEAYSPGRDSKMLVDRISFLAELIYCDTVKCAPVM